MGIAKFLGIGKEIAEPVDAVGNAFNSLFTSDDERLSRAEMMERIKQKPGELLGELDKIYAQSEDTFAKRARPFCVYVAGINAFLLGLGVVWLGKVNVPEWYITMTTTGFLGALGIYGIARSFEKLAGKIK